MNSNLYLLTLKGDELMVSFEDFPKFAQCGFYGVYIE
jgi:hypothetical protein